MKKILFLILSVLFISFSARAGELIIHCPNDFEGKNFSDGKWKNDEIRVGNGKGTAFYFNSQNPETALMVWDQENGTHGSQTIPVQLQNESVSFILPLNNELSSGIIVYQYFFRTKEMFYFKTNMLLGQKLYGMLHHSICNAITNNSDDI